MKQPLVSVIIPTFNRAEYLSASIESVIAQSYENWECIVIDDGSEDGTSEVMAMYAKRDPRITFVERTKDLIKGASECRNIGLNKASGEFIQYLDSDDLLHPAKIDEQLASSTTMGTLFTCKWGYFSGNPDLKRFKHHQMCYRNFRDPLKLLRYFGRYNEFLPLHNYLIPSRIAKKAGYWNRNLKNNDDAEYMTRILLYTKRVKFVPNSRVFYRVEGDDTLSGLATKENAMSAVESLRLININLASFPRTRKIYTDHLKNIIENRLRNEFPSLYKEIVISIPDSKC